MLVGAVKEGKLTALAGKWQGGGQASEVKTPILELLRVRSYRLNVNWLSNEEYLGGIDNNGEVPTRMI